MSTFSARSAPMMTAAVALGLGCSPGVDVETVKAKRGDLVVGVEVAGELESVDTAKIRPPSLPGVWNFKLSSLTPEGTVVKKGDKLGSFDAAEQMKALETKSNEAESAATEIKRQTSMAKMARANERLGLAEQSAAASKLGLKVDQPADLVAMIELKTMQLDHRVAELSVNHEQARSELAKRSDSAALAGLRDKLGEAKRRVAELKGNISRHTVVAERGGTVIHPTNHRGEKLKVGDSVWRMQSFVEVVSLENMRGKGSVDEVDSLRVKEGRPFSLRVDAHPDTELAGTVSSVGDSFVPKSPADPSKVVKVELAIVDSKELPLRPGMRFRGEIEVNRIEDVVTLPISSVFIEGAQSYVYRKSGSDFKKVEITVGARSKDEIEVRSGIEAGDEVARTKPVSP